MKRTMEETERRREKQLAYNEDHNITPKALVKSREEILRQTAVAESRKKEGIYVEEEQASIAADPVVKYMSPDQIDALIRQTRKAMEKAAKDLDFIEAARLRDEMYELEKIRENNT